MTNVDAKAAVIDALRLGLTLSIRALNGDAMFVGVYSASRLKSNNEIVYEYSCKQTFGCLTSKDIKEIAEHAIANAGRKIGTLAQKEVARFVLATKNRLS